LRENENARRCSSPSFSLLLAAHAASSSFPFRSPLPFLFSSRATNSAFSRHSLFSFCLLSIFCVSPFLFLRSLKIDFLPLFFFPNPFFFVFPSPPKRRSQRGHSPSLFLPYVRSSSGNNFFFFFFQFPLSSSLFFPSPRDKSVRLPFFLSLSRRRDLVRLVLFFSTVFFPFPDEAHYLFFPPFVNAPR